MTIDAQKYVALNSKITINIVCQKQFFILIQYTVLRNHPLNLNGLPPVMMTPTLLISKFLACFLEVHTEYLPPTTFNMLTLWIWEVSD